MASGVGLRSHTFHLLKCSLHTNLQKRHTNSRWSRPHSGPWTDAHTAASKVSAESLRKSDTSLLVAFRSLASGKAGGGQVVHSEGYKMQIPVFEIVGEKAGERKGEGSEGKSG